MTRIKLAVVILAAACLMACGSPPQSAQWGQGYETPQGYQEPDHSYLYYWMMYHSTMGYYQPSVVYHVYVPPVGYPSVYRPWQSREYVRGSDGRFVRQAPVVVRPVAPAQGLTPNRNVGGFGAAKPVVKDSRNTGGFAPKAASPPPTTRNSGGFSSSTTRTTTTTSSSSRNTGGFSSSKRK